MPGSWSPSDFPALTDANSQTTSPATRRYNCIAWAAGEDFRWWWPDPMGIGYWPPSASRKVNIESFLAAFATLGFVVCEAPALEPGIEKIAIYGIRDVTGSVVLTHAARQLESGAWTSKLGALEDISHETTDAVCGPLYGTPCVTMSRPRA
jgi:hypothetical protein